MKCVLVLCCLASLVAGEVYSIVQEPSLCPPGGGPNCSTLTRLLASPQPLSDHSLLRFTPGVHIVTNASRNNSMFVVRNAFNITLLGNCQIVCEHRMTFVFVNVTNLTIDGLSFDNCGASLSEDFVLSLKSFQSFLTFTSSHEMTVLVSGVTHLTLFNVSVSDSYGYGLFGHNVLGQSLITHSTFSHNNYNASKRGCYIPQSSKEGELACAGGGLTIAYTDPPSCAVARPVQQLTISHCSFVSNVNLYRSLGSGLALSLSQSNYGVIVVLDSLLVAGNMATQGANIAIFQHSITDNSSVTITNTISTGANTLLDPSVAFGVSHQPLYSGGGLWYSHGYAVSPDLTLCREVGSVKAFQGPLLTVTNSTFTDNRATVGAGAYVWVFPVLQENMFESNISFTHCDFAGNIGSSGAGMYINQLESVYDGFRAHFDLDNCTFSDNLFPLGQELNNQSANDADLYNTLYLNFVQLASLRECVFTHNYGTPLFAFNSKVHFYGDCVFRGNEGNAGGAVALHGSSLMVLHPHTHLLYTGNSAQRGGAIFVSPINSLFGVLLCFWQIDPEDALNGVAGNIDNLTDYLDIGLEFSDNRALSAGSVLYAGSRAKHCSLSLTSSHPEYLPDPLFLQLFPIQTLLSTSSDGVSGIASDPTQVCVCAGGTTPDCSAAPRVFPIFPGESITLSLVSVDRASNPSPGSVTAHLSAPSGGAWYSLEEGQQSQLTDVGCTNITYTILSDPQNLTLHLKTRGTILLEKSNLVSVIVNACPLGFVIDNSRCVCESYLRDIRADCDIDTQTIRIDHPYWVGKGLNNSTEFVKISDYCPLDYCSPDHAVVQLESGAEGVNRQCAPNRAGVLCGACAPGYSVVFGGNQCWKCSNHFILLVVVYALAGLFLVFSLYLFNTLTVSGGAINGLIFYANVIQVNRAILIPPDSPGVLPVFISWLNLDLGIPVCFYDGMDAFTKSCLQFVFPVYLLCILACVVTVSHYSPTASKIFTNKAVCVLTTILLLIFSRFQRTTANCLGFQAIQQFIGDNAYYVVWSFDGNIEYVRSKHGVLFLVALGLLAFVILPFIFVLLFAKQFQALSSHKYFRWVNKMKPLFDAYMGPYKDRYRGWTGLLLLVRQILIFVNFSNPTPEANLCAIIIVCLLVMSVVWYEGGVYRNWALNIVECSFLLNLSITSAASWYVHPLDSVDPPLYTLQQRAILKTSVSIALLEFTAVFIYAVYIRIIEMSFRSPYLVKLQQSVLAVGQFPAQVKSRLVNRKKSSSVEVKGGVGDSSKKGVTSQVVALDLMQQSNNELRESLLQDNTV